MKTPQGLLLVEDMVIAPIQAADAASGSYGNSGHRTTAGLIAGAADCGGPSGLF